MSPNILWIHGHCDLLLTRARLEPTVLVKLLGAPYNVLRVEDYRLIVRHSRQYCLEVQRHVFRMQAIVDAEVERNPGMIEQRKAYITIIFQRFSFP